jgi:hypothetical protein
MILSPRSISWPVLLVFTAIAALSCTDAGAISVRFFEVPNPLGTDSIGRTTLSANGRFLVCDHRGPFGQKITLWSVGDSLVPVEPGIEAIVHAVSDDGTAFVGNWGSAAFHRAGDGMMMLFPSRQPSEASDISADGTFAAGTIHTLDALQLAIACEARSRGHVEQFLSADASLCSVAELEGFETTNPLGAS